MKTFLKIIAYLFLVLVVAVSGWKFNRQIEKQTGFGDELIGMSQEQVIDKFGRPDMVRTQTMKDTDGYFQLAFKEFYSECNAQDSITFLYYDKLWFDYELWLKETDGENKVILVK